MKTFREKSMVLGMIWTIADRSRNVNATAPAARALCIDEHSLAGRLTMTEPEVHSVPTTTRSIATICRAVASRMTFKAFGIPATAPSATIEVAKLGL